jgi:hypothetical protein
MLLLGSAGAVSLVFCCHAVITSWCCMLLHRLLAVVFYVVVSFADSVHEQVPREGGFTRGLCGGPLKVRGP